MQLQSVGKSRYCSSCSDEEGGGWILTAQQLWGRGAAGAVVVGGAGGAADAVERHQGLAAVAAAPLQAAPEQALGLRCHLCRLLLLQQLRLLVRLHLWRHCMRRLQAMEGS